MIDSSVGRVFEASLAPLTFEASLALLKPGLQKRCILAVAQADAGNTADLEQLISDLENSQGVVCVKRAPEEARGREIMPVSYTHLTLPTTPYV